MIGKRRKKEDHSSQYCSSEGVSSLALYCEKLINDKNEPNIKYPSQEQISDRLRPTYLEAINTLQEAIHKLYATGQEARQVLEDSTPGGTSPASRTSKLAELVGYAHKLSFTISAPAGFVPGRDFLGLFKPPAPQEPQMQVSSLHNLPRYLEGPSPLKDDQDKPVPTEIASTDQPNLADILSKLPPMPAGWKPGDPIPGLSTALELPSQALAVDVEVKPRVQKAEPVPELAQKEAKEETNDKGLFSAAKTAFDFALNPDLEMVFEGSDKDTDESDDESDF